MANDPPWRARLRHKTTWAVLAVIALTAWGLASVVAPLAHFGKSGPAILGFFFFNLLSAIVFGIVANLLLPESTTVTTDEGGVRAPKARNRYIPFAEIEYASIRPSVFGAHAELVLQTKKGIVRLRLRETPPAPLLQEVLAGIMPRKRDVPPRAGSLARNGRELEPWLAEARALTAGGSTYRSTAPIADLEATFADAALAPDLRAAAAHAVLSSDDPDAHARVLAEIRETTAPLVVVAASLAEHGKTIDRSIVGEAKTYLDAADRTALASMPERAVHVRVDTTAEDREELVMSDDVDERSNRTVG